MSNTTEIADDGTLIDAASLPTTFGYNASNQVTSMTVTCYSNATGALRTFVRTLTWSGVNMTNISKWVGQ